MPNLGIDFGTTNSIAVAYDKKKNEFIYLDYRKKPTSSTIWFHDDKIEVGAEARKNMYKFEGVEGHHFEKSIKLKLDGNQKVYVFGEAMEPYKVAGLIIKELKKKGEMVLSQKTDIDINRAVFTVPINFSGQARKALRKSANEAGIDVITFIHEPFAAVVGYYFASGSNSSFDDVVGRINDLDGQYLLTFDWGGGTLDITVIQLIDGKMLEIGTAELTSMAGDKIDECIAKFVWNKFVDNYGHKYSIEYLEKVRKNKWGRLLAIAEDVKITLSKEEEADFMLFNIIEDDEIDEIITRADLEEIIVDILDAACNQIDKALGEAGIKDIDVSQVLLTGGTCYIPAVQKRMKERFGHRTQSVKDADLVIAQGAAVIAELGWLPFLAKDIQIELCDESFWAMFENGMPIASNDLAKRSEVFTCVDQREKIAKVIICEGAGQKKDKNLAVLNVPVLGDRNFGDDIYVEGELDKDIVLHIRANSKMVSDYNRNYSIQKSTEIYKLCFGLEIQGR